MPKADRLDRCRYRSLSKAGTNPIATERTKVLEGLECREFFASDEAAVQNY